MGAKGHWGTLLPALGVDSRYLRNVHGPCPICGGEDRFRWDNQHEAGGYICNSCGAGDGFNLAQKVTGRSFQDVASEIERILGLEKTSAPPPPDPEDVAQRNAMRRAWEGARSPLEHGPVSDYLKSRIGRQWLSNAIREHTGIFSEGALHPAMLAKVVSHDDKAVNLHVTFLAKGGRKASVNAVRKVMPGKLPDGCAIRLSPAAEVMGVAEGIETALSASIMFGVPVWACINGGLLSKWVPPKVVRKVMVFGDNDKNYTGQAKAYHLANRLVTQFNLEVDVMIPKVVGSDWNDEMKRGAKPPSPLVRHGVCYPLIGQGPLGPAVRRRPQSILAAIGLVTPSSPAIDHAGLYDPSLLELGQSFQPEAGRLAGVMAELVGLDDLVGFAPAG